MISKKYDESGWRLFRRYGNLGTEMLVAVLIGVAGGYQLDQWLGLKPLFLITGFVFGAAAGFLNVFRLLSSEDKKHAARKNAPKDSKREG